MNNEELQSAIQQALDQNLLLQIANRRFISAVHWHTLQAQVVQTLTEYHRNNPLRRGMQREQLRSQLDVPASTFNALLDSLEHVQRGNDMVHLMEHEIRFTDDQQAAVDRLMSIMAHNFTPPSFSEAAEIVGEPVLMALIELEELVRVQTDVILARPVYEAMVAATFETIDQRGGISAGELRDRFQTTRKYAIGLLEHLDNLKVTRRQGDVRVRGSRA